VEHVSTREWRAACERQAHAGGRFCGLFASAGPEGLHANCVFARAGQDHIVRAPAPTGEIDTVVDLFAAAEWDEREAHDSYGLRFRGHEPLRPLIDHPSEPEAWTVPIHGHDAYHVAVGPIHAGVIESGHFRLVVVGERILHLDLRLFHKHRGLQLAAEQHSLTNGLSYVQRACAACAVTNTVAYAQACESALGLTPDRQLRQARTLLLELERLYNHLNDIAAICAGVGFAPGAMTYAAFKERTQRLNERLTGHRFLFDTIALASSTLRIGQADAYAAHEELQALDQEQRHIWRELQFAASLQDRLDGVGLLTRHDAERLGAVGPVARASGVHHDTRSESPRLSYRSFTPATLKHAKGDVSARLNIRQAELEQTFAILDELLTGRITPGGVKASHAPSTDVGVARVESPRGETVCVVQSDGHTIERLHLRTGSYANWPVLAHVCRENLLPDFPLINKSFELCYACTDR
jgi:Ni,Fe-hydrogenase III large subunit